MRKPDARIIERLKSFLLVVLFLTTVLLLYFFWENASRDTFRLPEIIYNGEEEEVPKVADTVIPTEITVGFGNEVYTVISDGGEILWKQALEELKKIGKRGGKQSSDLLVSDISEETYNEAVSIKYPSIQFQFQYDIPFQEFCKYYNLPQAQGYEKIEGVSTIAWSGKGTESILIYQRSGNKYFAIVADQDYTDFEIMISEIEKRGSASYYPANTLFGSGVTNTTLLPLSLQSDLLEIRYEHEGERPEENKVRELAESFFGQSLDFIRQMKDTKGNVAYMYGYGQKIFHVYEDGTFEYKEETSGASGSATKFFDSLDLALNFVATHGSWNSLDGTDMSAYLKKVVPINQEKKKGYKFIFGMKVGSRNIYFENSTPIVVDVVDGQITYYRRDMIDFNQNASETYSSGAPETTFDPVTVLTENFDFIYEKLSEAGIELSPRIDRETAFDDIANHIRSMEIGYVRPENPDDGELVLKPCYRISFGKNITLYFDLFDNAEPIGSDNEKIMETGSGAEGRT